MYKRFCRKKLLCGKFDKKKFGQLDIYFHLIRLSHKNKVMFLYILVYVSQIKVWKQSGKQLFQSDIYL